MPGLKFILISGFLFCRLISDAQITRQAVTERSRQPADSTGTDTLKQKKVERGVEKVSPQNFFLGLPSRVQWRSDFSKFHRYDESDTLPGWVQSLGQTGKPLRRFVYGLPGYFIPSNVFVNPLNGMEEPYMTGLQGDIPYFDTRTSWVNVRYHQGARSLSLVNGTVSRNISPFFNLTGVYRHRRSEGVYFNNSTNDYNAYLSANAHTFNRKYHLFAAGVFNQLDENLNGGTPGTEPFDSSFRKQFMDVNLQDANYRRGHSGLSIRQLYRFYRDSADTKNKFALSASVLGDKFTHSYIDEFVNPDIQAFPAPVYPTLDDDSTSVNDQFLTSGISASGGFSYRIDAGKFSFLLAGTGGYTSRDYELATRDVQEEIIHRDLTSSLSLDLRGFQVKLHADGNLNTSSLFGDSRFLDAGLEFRGGPKTLDYLVVDEKKLKSDTVKWYDFTIHRPLRIKCNILERSRNPSFFESFFLGGPANLFVPQRNLLNQEAGLMDAEIAISGKRKKLDEQILEPMYLRIGAFISQMRRAIYFDSLMIVRQAMQGEDLDWQGLEFGFRLRWKRWTIENDSWLQTSAVNASGGLQGQFDSYVPEIYGNAALFYEKHHSKIAEILKFGLELKYQSAYKPLFFDPANQQFYAQPFLFSVPAYARLDACIMVRVKGVDLYLKVINAADELFLPGYYTTPYYPMLERTIMFGLDWSFFD